MRKSSMSLLTACMRFLARVNKDVTIECVSALQLQLTIRALKVLDVLRFMSDFVSAQTSLRLERFAANLANIVLLSCVNIFVIIKLSPAFELLWTLLALVGEAGVGMSLDVLLQNLLRSINLPTLRTHQRFTFFSGRFLLHFVVHDVVHHLLVVLGESAGTQAALEARLIGNTFDDKERMNLLVELKLLLGVEPNVALLAEPIHLR